MTDTCLIWCHGSLSHPWGDKSKSLAERAQASGMTLDAMDFQDQENPDQRVERLAAKLNDIGKPAILAGSSMGGYVACATAKQANVIGLFLLAPAFYLPGYAMHVFSGLPQTISVVHGWDDDVVPVENSIRFSKLHKAQLHLLPDGHRLSMSMDTIGSLFTHFLDTVRSQGQ